MTCVGVSLGTNWRPKYFACARRPARLQQDERSRTYIRKRGPRYGDACSQLSGAEMFVLHFRVLLSKSAPPIWVENHGALSCDKRGRPQTVTGALIDITAHKRAADTLAEMDRRKDEFLATLAHELRSPLASLRTAAQLLQDAKLDIDQPRLHQHDSTSGSATHSTHR